MHRKDIINLASLISIQAANAVSPLLIFPYALTVLGPGSYSTLATTEVVSILVMCVVLYSFEVDGVAKAIKANAQTVSHELSCIFSNILYSRLLLFFASVCLILVACVFLDSHTAIIALFWLIVPFSYAIQPAWLFQALESNFVYSIITVSSRLACLLLIYIYIESPLDAILVPLIIGSCYTMGSFISLLYVIFKLKIRLTKVLPSDIWCYLKGGRKIFGGAIAVTLYRDLNVVVLNIASSNPAAVATYSIAEKIIKGLQATIRPLNQVYFPKVLRELDSQRQPKKNRIHDVLCYIYPQLVVLISLVFILAISAYLLGDYFDYRSKVNEVGDIFILLIIMIPSVFLGVANYMLGTAGLNFLGAQAYLYKSIVLTGFLSLMSCFLLSIHFDAVGAAVTFVLAEFFLLIFIIRRYCLGI